MKTTLLVACATLMIGGAIAAAVADGDRAQGPDPVIARKMGYRTLANGAVVYEEIQDSGLENIAPAAGSDSDEPADPTRPQFKYDPLTQTYRRSTTNVQGQPAQDIVNTND
jgi:hypothetical protein